MITHAKNYIEKQIFNPSFYFAQVPEDGPIQSVHSYCLLKNSLFASPILNFSLIHILQHFLQIRSHRGCLPLSNNFRAPRRHSSTDVLLSQAFISWFTVHDAFHEGFLVRMDICMYDMSPHHKCSKACVSKLICGQQLLVTSETLIRKQK